tara:strand:+ start:81 stop:1733 length:1653 start_codon:yes stop_codon:yes gene_type:complete
MSRLYDEALLDAQKIREIAEQSAKDRIMESITPQIRKMINNRILFEQEEEFIDFDEEDADLSTDDDLDLDTIVDYMPDVDLDDDSMKAAEDAAIAVYAAGDVNIEVENESPDSPEEDAESIISDEVMSEAFMKLVQQDFLPDREISEKINRLSQKSLKLKKLMGALRESSLSGEKRRRLELSFISLIKEAVSLQHDLRHSGRGSQRLEKKLNSTIKEMREMSSKYKRNIFDFLFEAEEDVKKMEQVMEQDEAEVETDEAEVDVEVVDDIEVDVDVDAASSALEDLGDALGLDLEIAEAGDDEDLDLEDEEELELGDEELEEVYEVNETALRRELKRMRRKRLREQEEGRAAAADPYLAHDGEDLGDVVLDISEDDLLNALADELGDAPTPSVGGTLTGGDAMPESRRRRSRRISERQRSRRHSSSRTQRAVQEAATYKKAASNLKQQLVEMNLFNAKLLYANKLLQNKNLTVKQQRAIVEALDNAKTLREAKLLYKSLSGSLARRGRSGKTLSESVRRTLGSSSRSTRSAQPSKNGVETDRWAVLAGIGK